MAELKAGPEQFDISRPSGESNPSIYREAKSNTNEATPAQRTLVVLMVVYPAQKNCEESAM